MAGPREPKKIVDPLADLPETATPETRPTPEAELSPDQKRIRELEDRLAKSEGKKDPEQEWVEPAEGEDGNILIHFLEDGFTALGQVFVRGQELEFTPGSPAYEDTKDRYGNSWLALRNDEFKQVDRWGKIMFRTGPWPGKTYADGQFQSLKAVSGDGQVEGPSKEELQRAWDTEQKRKRAAPSLPRM